MSFFQAGEEAGTTEEIHVSANEAEIRRVAEQIGRILRVAIASALGGSFEKELSGILGRAFNGSAARNVAAGLGNVGREAHNSQKEITELSQGLNALASRSQAFKASLSTAGQDNRLFAVFDEQVHHLLELEQDLKNKRVQLANDPELLAAYQAEARSRIRVLEAESVSVGRIIDNARSRNTGAIQQETTLRNAEIRTQGAFAVATEQRTARARIEAFRFATRQILFLERQLVNAFRGTLNLAGSLARGIAAGLGRVTAIFRRGDASINDGLQGALSQRERAMRESFSRQERATRTTVAEQSRLIQQLQDRQSKGFAGLISGRSQLGSALGVGGILGGGILGGSLLSGGLGRFTTLERVNIQLDRLTGSATATRDILKDLVQLAKETPLELTDVSTAAVGLLAAGTGLKQVVPFVQSLADAIGFTGGGAEQLQRVALAIRQIASKGRLQGEEIRQLAESLPGLNIPQLLADQITKGDTGLLLKMSEAGQISAQEFSKAFAAALASDPRIVGASTATVNTLGGQIAILKETFDTLGAAIIGALKPFLLFSIKGTTNRLNFLTNLITDGTNPALQLLKKGLIGVAAGLAAIAALKAAGEVLQFVALGMRAIITPIGLLVAAFAAIGGAIAALRVINPVFREMTDRLASLASGKILTGLSRVAEILVGLGTSLVRNVAPALAVFAGIIDSVIAPVLGGIAGLVVNVFLPALGRIASTVAGLVVPAIGVLGGVLADVLRFLEPAINGFGDLARAIRDAFGGDFGGLLDIGSRIIDSLKGLSVTTIVAAAGLGALGFAIGGPLGAAIALALGVGFSGALGPVLGVIRGQLERVKNLIQDALGGINLTALVVSISKVAQRIGFIIGNIVSDPRVIQVLEAGALIAGRFLLGFAQGLLSNLPGIVDLFAGQFVALLGAGLRSAFDNPKIAIVALTALLASGTIINFIRNVGKNWGRITSDGVVSGFAGSARRLASGVQAFFAGGEAVRARATAKMRQNTINDFQRLSRDIQALGAKPNARIINTSQIDKTGVDNLRRQFKELTAGVDEAATRAVIARAQFDRFRQGLGGVGAGIRSAFGGDFTTASARFRTGLGNMRLALKDFAQDLRNRGTNLGQTLGAGVLGGLAAAFSASQGGAIGVIGALSSILVTGLSAGPVAAAVAAVGAGIGTVIGIFKQGKEAAERYTEQVKNLAQALRDLGNVGDAVATIQETLNTRFQEAFSDTAATALAGLFPANFFGTIATQITSGGADIDKAFDDTVAGLGLTPEQTRRIQDSFGAGFDFTNQGKFLNTLLKTGDVEAFGSALEKQGIAVSDLQKFFGTLTTVQDQYGRSVELNTALAKLNSDATQQQTRDLQDLSRAQSVLQSGGPVTLLDQAQVRQSTQSVFDTVTGLLDGFKVSASDTFDAVLEFARENSIQIDLSWLKELIAGFDLSAFSTDNAKRANDRYFQSLGELNVREDELAAGRRQRDRDRQKAIADLLSGNELVGKAIEQLNKQRTEGIQSQVDGLTNRLEAARTAAQAAKEALTDFITAQFVDSPQALVDDLIGSIDGVGSAIEAAALQGGVQGEAAIRSALGGLDSDIAKIVQAGVAAGLNGQQITDLVNQVQGAVGEQVSGSGARISTLDFTDGITPEAGRRIIEELNRVLDPFKIDANARALFNAESEVDKIQQQLDSLNAELQVDVKFSTDQIIDALVAAGAPLSVAQNLVTPGAVSAAQQGSDLVSVIDTFLASLGTVFGNNPGQPLTPDQVTQINTTILGISDPDTTASAAVGAMSAAAGGVTTNRPVNRTTIVAGTTSSQVGTINPNLR